MTAARPRRPLIERALEVIAPTWAMRRSVARLRLHQAERALTMARKFDAAARGRRGKHWPTSGGSANTEVWGALSTLRNRSRDAIQNDPWLESGVDAWVDNAVGKGIQPSWAHSTEAKREEIRRWWVDWAESTSADPEGLTSYYGLQAQAFNSVVSSGEAVLLPVFDRRRRGQPPALKIRVLEGDYIDTDKNEVTDGRAIVQGIEYDRAGNRIAVWLFDQHPGEQSWGWKSNRVKARRYRIPDQAFVMMRPERPGQCRGIPWTASVLLRARDLLEFEDAKLVQQKIAACFSGFVYDSDGFGEAGGPTEDDEPPIDTFEPGMIEHLPPGKRIEIAQPQMPHGYSEYQGASLRAIAAGLGIPFEVLTGDYASFPFSAARMSRMSFNRRIRRTQSHLIVPQFGSVSLAWWRLAAGLADAPIEGAEVRRWIPPRQDMVQPEKDVPANLKRLESGLVSPQQLIREQGEAEPEDVLEEIAQFKQAAEAAGLHFTFAEKPPEPAAPAAPPAKTTTKKERGTNGHDSGRMHGCLV